MGRDETQKANTLTSRRRGVERAPRSGRVVSRQLIGIMDDDPLGWYALALGSLSGNGRCRHLVVTSFLLCRVFSARLFNTLLSPLFLFPSSLR